ncbi:hypothetical protein OG455_31095 [Kitasatospora sp. NBC_01287]|uniref:hypothetical protein n=1 Tax=Kitasatospora sp. NBC_01287 TaxID=2903573 RepID=UPI0022555BE9|nr:hypothetical protein [Kitasatospora sp. NBC_01287]MCX4749912.1 hypothetical protein [Kitasatospora sp. NBC_01287]
MLRTPLPAKRLLSGKRLLPAVALAASAVLLATAAPAQAAAPGGPYSGMGNCPTAAPAMTDPANLQVGCVVSVTNAGSFTIGTTTVPLTSPITLQFGVYWDKSAPVVTFPDGSTANQYATVAPTGANLLTAQPAQITIPGIINFLPGITSVFAQVELAGPVTDFTPLAAGESYPVFTLPVKLHLSNAFFGGNCYIGSNSSPILLHPTTGTTAPPAPAKPMTGDPGTIAVNADPNGYNTLIASFTGASLVDNTFSVPGASGCGLGGILDPIIDWTMGIPSGAGQGSVSFQQTDTTLALDTGLSDLTGALGASAKH